MSHGLGRQHQTTLLLFCLKEFNSIWEREPIFKSYLKIKNHVMKVPVKYSSSYKDIFNLRKENIEPVSVKYSDPKPKFVLLASPTFMQPCIYELMSRESATCAEI